MTPTADSTDTTDARAFVLHWLPYLRAAAARHAFRLQLAPADLTHEFVVYLLEEWPKWLAVRDRVSPTAFVLIRVRRVLSSPAMKRRLRSLAWEHLDATSEPWTVAGSPATVVEEADDLAKLRELLDALSPRRREVLALRFGLDGSEPKVGVECGAALGIRPSSATDIVLNTFRELAHGFGTDVRRAGVDPGEARGTGLKVSRKKPRAAG